MEPIKISLNEAIKINMVRLAEDHKKNCHDPSCGISLFLVGQLLKIAGIKLTDKERMLFM